MAEQKFNSGYSPIPEADTVVEGPSMTEQSHLKACDIKNIVKRFERTAVVEHVNAREAQYTDVSEVPDYHGALEVVKGVQEMFSSMPAVLRDRFENDAGVYLAWINAAENAEEARELGLLPAEQVGAAEPPAAEPPQAPSPEGGGAPAPETTTPSAERSP